MIVDIEHPSKTRTTPTPSIQFRCPGRIDDSTVYWDISMKTTSVDTIRVNVLPDMYFGAMMHRGQTPAHKSECIVTITVSNMLPGNTGVSKANIATADINVLIINVQNRTCKMLSVMHGFRIVMRTHRERKRPAVIATMNPTVLLSKLCG